VSDGTPGSAAPSTALQVAGTDGTDLRTIATDASGDVQVVGTLTDNVNPPAANNVGVLSALATYQAYQKPARLQGTQGLLSMDLGGNLRTRSRTEGVLGDVSTAARYNQCEINFGMGVIDAKLVTVTTDAHPYGSVVNSTGMAVVSTGANAAGFATAVSTQALEYRPAHEFYAMFTALFTVGTANSFQRIGPMNLSAGSPKDGFCIGYEGTVFSFTQWQNGVDIVSLAQSSWNGDPCDGSAGSLFTSLGVPVAWNQQHINIYRISGSWFGTGPLILEILSPDAEFVTLHTFHYPNSLTTPTTYTNNYNMSIMVSNVAGNTSNVSLSVPCIAMGTFSQFTKITDTLTDYTLANTTRAVIAGKVPAGGYANVSLTPDAALTVGGSGNTNLNAATWTTTTGGGGTPLNTTLLFLNNTLNYTTVQVALIGSGTISAGAIAFEVSLDNSNWVSASGFSIHDNAPMPNTGIWAIHPASQDMLVFSTAGGNYFRARLSTQITGATGQVVISYNVQGLTTSVTRVTSSNNQGNPAILANAWPQQITDTVNGPVAVKPASTAAIASDAALVVAISPNNSVAVSGFPSNTNTVTGDSPTIVTATTTNGATQTNANARGAIITAILGTVSGTLPTLSLQLQWSPDGGTTWLNYGSATSAIAIATGNTVTVEVYPTALALTLGGAGSAQTNAPLPRTWRMAYTTTGTGISIAVASVQVNYCI